MIGKLTKMILDLNPDGTYRVTQRFESTESSEHVIIKMKKATIRVALNVQPDEDGVIETVEVINERPEKN